MKTNEFILPEKWCIKGCKELSEYFTEFGLNNRKNKQRSDVLYPLGGDCEDQYYYKIEYPSWDYDRQPKGVEITFDQFKEHVLKEIPKPEYDPKDVAFNVGKEFHNQNDESITIMRPIIGYKLIKPEYKKAAELIAFHHIPNLTNRSFICQNGACFTEDCKVKDNLEKAGVMHWFEAVYDTSITLKSGVKLSEDDIAEVKEILNKKQNVMNETKMVYVTKSALTKGIEYIEVLETHSGEFVKENTRWGRALFKNDWFENKEDAIKNAEERKIKKLQNLDKQIKKISALKFSF